MESSGEQFLHKKNPSLHTTSPVGHEQERRKLAGLETSQKPAEKIASWLGIIEKTHMGHGDDLRARERIKGYYHKEHVIKPENIPQSYWNLQGEIAVNEGRKQDLINAGVVIEETVTHDANGQEVKKRIFTFPEETKMQAEQTVISNQQQSLDKWIDYLASYDAPYPMWAKYWAFRSVVKMGKLEKKEDGKARFANRDKDTVASFPVLNQRALANTIGAMSARLEAKNKPKEQQPTENLSTKLSDEEYQKLVSTEDFAKLYAQFLVEIPEYATQGLEETRGKWVKYDRESNPEQLVKSLEGYPLEWCTADKDTAKTQLEGGDFYVYYSMNEEGDAKIPRLAIRMEGVKIAEPPRGIAPSQNLDPYIAPVLEQKLDEFGEEGKSYKKRAADMKHLTAIEQKGVTAEDLTFLYEIDNLIEGFGYERDPRIEELLSQRNPEDDMPIVFGCEKSQIAHNPSQIRPDTKAYVGKLISSRIFNKLQHVDYIYTSFPEGKIHRKSIEIGGKTKEQLLAELAQSGMDIDEYNVRYMFKSPDFTTLPIPQTLDTVRLKVGDLGLYDNPTTDQLYKKAHELGLVLCPAELGPQYRLQYPDQPFKEWFNIGMQQIADRDGPKVFTLFNFGSLYLANNIAFPTSNWDSSTSEWVFSLPKNSQKHGLFNRILKR